MPGLNLQNFFGNIYLSGTNNNFLRKKIGKDKFSISQNTTSPLIFNDNIFFLTILEQFLKLIKEEKLFGKKIFTKK